MAHGRRQRRRYKRRSTGQTDYHRRLKLLRSGTPRAVGIVSPLGGPARMADAQPRGDENGDGERDLATGDQIG